MNGFRDHAAVKQTISQEYQKRPGLFGSPEPIMAIIDMAAKQNLTCTLSHFTLGIFDDPRGKRVYFYNDPETNKIIVTEDDGVPRKAYGNPEAAFEAGLTLLFGPLDRIARET